MTWFVARLTLSLSLAVTVALSLLETAACSPQGTMCPDMGCLFRIIIIVVYMCMNYSQMSGPASIKDSFIN